MPGASVQPPPAGGFWIHLKADAALASFATTQVSNQISLCLGQIRILDIQIQLDGPLSQDVLDQISRLPDVSSEDRGGRRAIYASRDIDLQALLKGIDFALPTLPPGPISSRVSFFGENYHEVGFLAWSLELTEASAGNVEMTLRPAEGARPEDECPNLEVDVRGAILDITVPTPTPPPPPEPSPTARIDPPGRPISPRLVEQTRDSLTLQWDFPIEARSFNLYLDGTRVAMGHITPNYYRFEGLRVNTGYRLGVSSVNAGGESEIVTITGNTINGRNTSGNF
ncbi:MAG: hypothetical protein CVV27_03610 [Candidatus Melainabacteria bacterium HGW-Melainabacteria-1]|nr:MAG: hypothetical protein CVV27_03610 [Candidatus Melainabacteria bacterium HGW-Melainabacteria-1]